MNPAAPGFFGKVSSHGDFVSRRLPPDFVQAWDNWLQQCLHASRQQLGSAWLAHYLTSPIWRFVLSHGVLNEGRWAGILMPSVDQVGRYFPFTIAVRLPDNKNPLEFISQQTSWYVAIEELGLLALNGEIALDDLVQELEGVKLGMDSAYAAADTLTESCSMQIDMEFEEQSAASVYPFMLDALLSKQMSSYSIWSTTGSERVAPCVFDAQGLPAVGKLPAMLDGQWRQWGWTQPYTLQPEPSEADSSAPTSGSSYE